jgi:hypothetical protein
MLALSGYAGCTKAKSINTGRRSAP